MTLAPSNAAALRFCCLQICRYVEGGAGARREARIQNFLGNPRLVVWLRNDSVNSCRSIFMLGKEKLKHKINISKKEHKGWYGKPFSIGRRHKSSTKLFR